MLLLFVSGAFAQSDISIKLNTDQGAPALGNVLVGENSRLEIWMTNGVPLAAASLGLQFTSTAGAFTFNTGYGTRPPTPTHTPVMMIHDPAALPPTVWNIKYSPSTNAEAAGLPNQILLGGAGTPGSEMPAHAASSLLWSFSLNGSSLADTPGGFCVDNIFVPPAGTWTFNDGVVGFAPTFQLNPNTSEANPDAPAVCFDVATRPCNPVTITVDPGAAVNKNHCSAYTFDFDATTVDPPISWSTSAGTINAGTGELSVPNILTCGSTPVDVTATNGCGSIDVHSFTITWTNNNPTISNCPAIPGKVAMGNTYNLDLNSVDADPCDAAAWTVAHTGGPVPTGTFSISGTGVFSFNTVNPTDGGNTYEFTATVTDPCGGSANCVFQVEVLATQPWVIKIEKTHNTIQGLYEYVSITKEGGSDQMGGFDFLIAYDASALSFFSATLGAALGPAGCGWEYFTYRFGAQGNCGGPCPSGLLRVVAIADINNGANHPSCFSVANGDELVSLKFYVTNDRTFECMYVPIRFAWMDCGDNGISNIGGDTLWISSQVFDFENTDPLTDPSFDITDMSCYFAIAYGGACAACDVSQKYEPVRFILFWNGGVDIVCADSIDAPGDLNLNGIAYEIADAVLYTNYFLYGTSALDPNPQFRQAQIAASDANQDGSVLTVGDLVYLLRVVVGDAVPFPKLVPFANTANVNLANGTLSTEASVDLGGVYATFQVNGGYTLTSNTDMEVLSAENDGVLKVLVYAGTNNMSNRLDAGSNSLFTIDGNVELVNVEVADYNGNMMNTRVNKNVLPTEFALSQNVPNPFNPTTKIGLDLPTASDWNLSVYNVAGQLVQSINGRGVGNIQVELDAKNWATGVYFYKATAGSFTATKKMVLMK
jgi:hypothetical protein